MASELSKRSYEFGPFRIDLDRYLLLRGGKSVPLSPKVLETLIFLLEHRGSVVKKDEIMSRVWPDTFVEEGNLAQNIFLLRKALGEEKNEHKYIITIPGVGYRFVAPASESFAQSSQAVPTPHAPITVGSVRSIAVLPFKNLVRENADEFLGPGIADALIMRLSSIRHLRVRPTSAVLKYANSLHDPVRIGEELNVDALLDGVYQRVGEQIRVSVQLVSVTNGITLWAVTIFDENFKNIFAIQDSISEQVVRSLALKLSGEEQNQLAKSYTDNAGAFQLYIKSRYFWNERTIEGLKKGLECAQQAIALDPTYAPAYVGLADSYSLLGAQHSVLSPQESFPKARAAALRALEIDERMAEAYASLAFINCCFEWDWPTAEQNYLKAITLKPNYATAHHWYGEMLTTAGRFNESLAQLQVAQELDPLSLAINVDLAAAFYYAREYDRSENQLDNLLELNPGFIRARVILGQVYEQQRKYSKAVEMLRSAVKLSDEDQVTLSALAHTLALAGETREASKILDDLVRPRKGRYVSAGNIATLHIALGQNEFAFDALEEAFKNRDIEIIWLRVNPVFDPLRSDPRFTKLLERVSPVLLGTKGGAVCTSGHGC
jgi:DNA-binding winged helix-turn-helix (wHTH) protein/Tfp pilus assembly protein PilF